jgi:hypothetical protein
MTQAPLIVNSPAGPPGGVFEMVLDASNPTKQFNKTWMAAFRRDSHVSMAMQWDWVTPLAASDFFNVATITPFAFWCRALYAIPAPIGTSRVFTLREGVKIWPSRNVWNHFLDYNGDKELPWIDGPDPAVELRFRVHLIYTSSAFRLNWPPIKLQGFCYY